MYNVCLRSYSVIWDTAPSESLVNLTIDWLQKAKEPVVPLRWATSGAATEGVTPLFFPEKPGDLFLVASSAVSPLISSSQKLTIFSLLIALSLFIAFTRVSPPRGCHPTPFLRVRPRRFSTILCKFAHKNFFPLGVTSLEGVTRGGPPPRRPLVTPLQVANYLCQWGYILHDVCLPVCLFTTSRNFWLYYNNNGLFVVYSSTFICSVFFNIAR